MSNINLGEILPLFAAVTPETLEWLSFSAHLVHYDAESIVVAEEDWGKEAYFIVSGWMKICHRLGEQTTTVEILGVGDCFGEMAILERPLKHLTAITLAPVQLLVIPAQRFLQLLLKEPTLQQKILKLTIRRTMKLYRRLQIYNYPPKTKLIKTLLILADYYGRPREAAIALCNFPVTDLAALAQISPEEAATILDKLIEKGWLEIDTNQQLLYLINPKQLAHLVN
jgi:CRP/FNR family transcriptional regulator, cyclic AMP receptor protein